MNNIEKKCESCNGKGYVDNLDRSLSPLWCFDCDGTGQHSEPSKVVTIRRDGTVVELYLTH